LDCANVLALAAEHARLPRGALASRIAMELYCQIGSGDGRQCYADALARAKLATTLSLVVP
jgi:hypothetical protein